MTEAALTAIAFLEGFNGFKFRADHGNEYHLSNPFTRLDGK